MFGKLVCLSEEDRELIIEASKTDLQRKQDELDKVIEEKKKLEDINIKYRSVLQDIVHLYYTKGCFSVMLTKSKAQLYNYANKIIPDDFNETLDIPIDKLVIEAINEMLGDDKE